MTLPPGVAPLPDGVTMELWPLASLDPITGELSGAPLYGSRGKWLHPLFDLLDALEPAEPRPQRMSPHGATTDPTADPNVRRAIEAAGELFLHDRVIGTAAAFLILRAGIRHAWGDLVSDGALAEFEANGASLRGGEQVSAIGCMTEELLRGVDDPDVAWALLSARRQITPHSA
jgi:hypothetical protein